MKKTYRLNTIQTRNLSCFIVTGFQFKTISTADINYDPVKCEIENIRGIDVKTLMSNKKLNVCLGFQKVHHENVNEKQTMRELWLKYLNTI